MQIRYQARLYELRPAPIIRPLSDYVLVYREAKRLSLLQGVASRGRQASPAKRRR